MATLTDRDEITTRTNTDVVHVVQSSVSKKMLPQNLIRKMIRDETGTGYTFVLTDQEKIVTMNNASSHNLTIPANSSVAFPIGTEIRVINKGAGIVTIGITSDTLTNNIGGVTVAKDDKRTLRKIEATVWNLGF